MFSSAVEYVLKFVFFIKSICVIKIIKIVKIAMVTVSEVSMTEVNDSWCHVSVFVSKLRK